MFFELTEEQRLVQDTARRFALEDIAPTLEQEEKNHEFKLERVAKMGELGFFHVCCRKSWAETGWASWNPCSWRNRLAGCRPPGAYPSTCRIWALPCQ